MRAMPEPIIRLYKPNELPICRDRLVRVILFLNELRYGSWHFFTKIHRQFREKFGHSMPGVTNIYDRQVRTEFDFRKFFDAATPEQFFWILPRLPSGFITPPRPIVSPTSLQ